MQDYKSLCQFKANYSVYCESISDLYPENEDPLYICSEIFTFNFNKKVVYIAIMNGIYSSKDHYQGVKFFAIENNKLNSKIAMINTKEGLKNEYGVYYNWFSVMDRKERPIKLIKFDNKNIVLSFPIIGITDEVTNKYIDYKFNGKYFELK